VCVNGLYIVAVCMAVMQPLDNGSLVITLYHLSCRRGGRGRGGGVRHIEVGKEAAMEAEMQAARERAVVPLETRVQQFMEMLTEKEVYYCCFQLTIPFISKPYFQTFSYI